VLFTPPVGRGNKLLPKHRGPFQVMEKTDSIYIIEDLVSGKRITTHIHNLRPFIYDPIRTNPLTVAQHNEQEFIVESILGHRGNRNRRSTRQFNDPMVIEIDRTKCEVPRNRLPPRHHSAEKQTAIRTLGVIEESQVSEWSQAHPVPKGDGQWRLTLDFVQLNAATKGLEGWPIPNILETLTRLGTMKPTCFGLLDFTAGYHQIPLDPASRVPTAFRAAGGLYQWTRVAMRLKGSALYFQRSMQNKVLNGLVYEICEIYIDDVLIYGKSEAEFLRNVRRVFERLRAKKSLSIPRKPRLVSRR